MRYRQIWNKELQKSEFIPIDAAARNRETISAIHGDIQPFVSPVDGTVISDRRQLREHNKRNNVVNTHEFDQGFLDRKQKERERLYTGEHTPAEKLARKRELYEVFARADREHG